MSTAIVTAIKRETCKIVNATTGREFIMPVELYEALASFMLTSDVGTVTITFKSGNICGVESNTVKRFK